jgi:hypothetical protein
MEDLRTRYSDPPISLASNHPEVPPPNDPLSPKILAARWQAHDLYPEDMPGLAADLLEQGHDTPALRRLAGEMQLDNSEAAQPLVEKVFRELGVLTPIGEDTARLVVSRQVAREVIAGQRNVWSAANYLELVIWRWDSFNADLQEIFAINDEIDWDTPHRRSLLDLRNALIAAYVRLATMQLD